MEAVFSVKELVHDDLVTLLSDAFYGNSSMWFHTPKEMDNKYRKCEGDCKEDIAARTLLAGGYIEVVDYEDEWETEKELQEYYEKNKHLVPVSFFKEDEEDECGYSCYRLTYADILKAYNSEEGARDVMDLINGNNDFWTGYNLIQIAMFGEVVYG